MTIADRTDKNRPLKPVRARGLERYEHIIDCAQQVLATCRAEDLSIYDVVAAAGLPAQAVYRIFPSVQAVLFAVAQRYQAEIIKAAEAADYGSCADWQDFIRMTFSVARDFYNGNKQALDLLLGSGSTRDIRTADLQNIRKAAMKQLEGFVLVEGPLPVVHQLEVAIDIVDAVWARSYEQQGEISPYYHQEAIRAATAYLELYLPRHAPGPQQLGPDQDAQLKGHDNDAL